MATYELKDRTVHSAREFDNMSKGDRDDIQLQRLGKKPVLKVSPADIEGYDSIR